MVNFGLDCVFPFRALLVHKVESVLDFDGEY